jgi:hypothetical protein
VLDDLAVEANYNSLRANRQEGEFVEAVQADRITLSKQISAKNFVGVFIRIAF